MFCVLCRALPPGHVIIESYLDRLSEHYSGSNVIPGEAVQVESMKPKLKPPGTERLKLKCDILLSTSAFKSNSHHYIQRACCSGCTLWARPFTSGAGRRPRPQRRWPCTLGRPPGPSGRGLHSSTSQLNLSAFCGIGGALRGYVARDEGVLGGFWVCRVFSCVIHGSS